MLELNASFFLGAYRISLDVPSSNHTKSELEIHGGFSEIYWLGVFCVSNHTDGMIFP